MFARRALLSVAALIVFYGSAFASGPNDVKTFSVAVTVIDEKNQPVPDATVEVHSGDKSLGASATDTSGKINLSLASVGAYSPTISKKGYLNTGTTVEVSSYNPVQDMDVVVSSAALSQQSVTVSSHFLVPCGASSRSSTGRLGPTGRFPQLLLQRSCCSRSIRCQ